MIICKCIQKFRDKHGRIYGYRLVAMNGDTKDIRAKALKNAIINKQVSVVNLSMTSDGRLIDAAENKLTNTNIIFNIFS